MSVIEQAMQRPESTESVPLLAVDGLSTHQHLVSNEADAVDVALRRHLLAANLLG